MLTMKFVSRLSRISRADMRLLRGDFDAFDTFDSWLVLRMLFYLCKGEGEILLAFDPCLDMDRRRSDKAELLFSGGT